MDNHIRYIDVVFVTQSIFLYIPFFKNKFALSLYRNHFIYLGSADIYYICVLAWYLYYMVTPWPCEQKEGLFKNNLKFSAVFDLNKWFKNDWFYHKRMHLLLSYLLIYVPWCTGAGPRGPAGPGQTPSQHHRAIPPKHKHRLRKQWKLSPKKIREKFRKIRNIFEKIREIQKQWQESREER